MNQFKPIFLGSVNPATPLGRLARACNTQKCIRAGGKHNDLDDVGKDTYHHTFFEMLGNWSFGDYFKREAISWAWELLTQIYATYFGGDEKAGLPPDTEARDIWLNFLPATSIAFGCKFNRESDGSLRPLPAKHVDTGMGFERNRGSTILWRVGADDVDKKDMAYRVVADHIRTLSFAIADGNEGREYVLRRILRRAVRYGREVLNAQEGFFSSLVEVVVKVMGDVFPELKQHELKIKDIIAEEEASFGRTLVKGIDRFKKAVKDVQGKKLSGQDAFVLWDTYGFPMDLTQLMAEEIGLTVDVEGFNAAMEEARQKARSARNKATGDSIVMDADATSELRKRGLAATDDSAKFVWHKGHESVVKAIYTGSDFIDTTSSEADIGLVLESTSFYAEQGGQIYDTGSIEGSFGSFQVSDVQLYGGFVLHIGSLSAGSKALSVGDKVICKVDYERRTLIAPNHTCTHMLNFALREVLGDHVDQKGSIVLPEKLRFDFSHGKPVHPEDLRKIELIVNQQIKDALDVYASEANLADARRITGLRAVFGEIYPDPVRVVSIGRKVEDLLNDPDNKEWLSISTELCGGTHISNTREAKAFALLSEEGIAKGVRRITAVTTECAFKAMELAASLDSEIRDATKSEGSLLEKKVASFKSRLDAAAIPAATKADLRAKISQLEDQLRKAKKKIGEENIQKAVKAATEVAEAAASEGKAFCVSRAEVGLDTTAVREAVIKVMDQKGLAIMVFSTDEASNKAVVYAGVPSNRSEDGFAVLEWLTAAMEPLKGKGGGGKNGVAQGQGSDASRVEEAIDIATKFAAMKLR
ncbi:Alanine--tRNA ligase [Ananas comosus]|uniref:Alanine--tRNA ligase n=1 Tax=Ananas comosus TaxID=4615 RepID=A0A199VNB8_ANACO|nr:Alanine--tRNA ligase [Ananas comosus]